MSDGRSIVRLRKFGNSLEKSGLTRRTLGPRFRSVRLKGLNPFARSVVTPVVPVRAFAGAFIYNLWEVSWTVEKSPSYPAPLGIRSKDFCLPSELIETIKELIILTGPKN